MVAGWDSSISNIVSWFVRVCMSVAIGTFWFGLGKVVAYQLIWMDFDSLGFESALYTCSLHRYYLYSCS